VVKLFWKRASHDRAGEKGLPFQFAMGALHFPGIGVSGGGVGVKSDRVLLLAMRASDIHHQMDRGNDRFDAGCR
jgi:hypothetical protein